MRSAIWVTSWQGTSERTRRWAHAAVAALPTYTSWQPTAVLCAFCSKLRMLATCNTAAHVSDYLPFQCSESLPTAKRHLAFDGVLFVTYSMLVSGLRAGPKKDKKENENAELQRIV